MISNLVGILDSTKSWGVVLLNLALLGHLLKQEFLKRHGGKDKIASAVMTAGSTEQKFNWSFALS